VVHTPRLRPVHTTRLCPVYSRAATDNSKALDVWKLAREGSLVPGQVCTVRWLRGDAETGSISFVAMDGYLRFHYTQSSYWSDTKREYDYAVQLKRTPSKVGGERVWFECPRCHQRVRMLYIPPGGGRFACRRCHDLAYSSQHQSRTHRAFDRLFSLADQMSDPTPSLAQFIARSDAYDTAHAATFGRWEERSRRAEEQRASQLRGPGRPSKRELRERARLERQALRPPAPTVTRPRGRPKTKRPYVRRQPTPELSEVRTDRQAYCVKCRDRRDLRWARAVTLTNGRPAIRGRCAVCRTQILRLTAAERSEQ